LRSPSSVSPRCSASAPIGTPAIRAQPKKYLRDAVFSDYLSLHLIGVEFERLCWMDAEAQAVEEGAGAQHAIMPALMRAISGETSKPLTALPQAKTRSWLVGCR
jgi:hypothetical protein